MWREKSAVAVFTILLDCEHLLQVTLVSAAEQVNPQVARDHFKGGVTPWILIWMRCVSPDVGCDRDVRGRVVFHDSVIVKPNEMSWISH
jgi:hypothetical protein